MTMKEKMLRKDSVKELCAAASKEWETYVPVEWTGGDIQFTRLDDKDKEQSLSRLNLDYEWLVIPPKFIAFPQLESLFQFQDGRITETVETPRKKLLFGLRACDLKGILFVDDFFRRNFEDTYYLNRSMNKLLVVVGCKKPLRDCFCASTKTGPFLPQPDSSERGKYADFDLQLVDTGDAYVVETGTEKGEEFVQNYKTFFDDASKEMIQAAKTAKLEAEEAVRLKVDFDKAIKKMCEDNIPQQIYERIGERCIYCGGCLYVCPTCTCFNVFDEKKGNSGIRYRNWDACVFEGYTREASGHNPRSQKWVRTSRRYEHKLKYDYLTTGMSGCVGCGRCLASCPVDISMSKFIQEITEAKRIM